jgi:hypothetical protein
LSIILSKDSHRKLPRGRRPSYTQKISVRSSRADAEHTTLEITRKKRLQKEETVKILVIFSRIIKIHEEELQDRRTFKELEEFVQNR